MPKIRLDLWSAGLWCRICGRHWEHKNHARKQAAAAEICEISNENLTKYCENFGRSYQVLINSGFLSSIFEPEIRNQENQKSKFVYTYGSSRLSLLSPPAALAARFPFSQLLTARRWTSSQGCVPLGWFHMELCKSVLSHACLCS